MCQQRRARWAACAGHDDDSTRHDSCGVFAIPRHQGRCAEGSMTRYASCKTGSINFPSRHVCTSVASGRPCLRTCAKPHRRSVEQSRAVGLDREATGYRISSVF
jgi:hypothetical protein